MAAQLRPASDARFPMTCAYAGRRLAHIGFVFWRELLLGAELFEEPQTALVPVAAASERAGVGGAGVIKRVVRAREQCSQVGQIHREVGIRMIDRQKTPVHPLSQSKMIQRFIAMSNLQEESAKRQFTCCRLPR